MGFVNDLQLRNLKFQGKRVYVSDEATLNLYVRVSKTKKTFVYRYKIQGVIKEISLGDYPKITLAQARAEAERLNLEDKSLTKDTITLERLFDECDIIDDKRKSSLNRHIVSVIGHRDIKELKRADFLQCLDKLAKEQKFETCKKALQSLKRLLKYAVNREYIEYNVLADIDYASLYPTPKVEHLRAILDKNRFKDLLLAIESFKCSLSTKVCLQLSPYVFLRSSNIRNLEWSEIDFTQKIISIPASKMKGGEEFIVPLTESSIQILKSVQPHTGNGRLVFPSDIGKDKALSESTLNQAIKRMGFGEEMVYHGFRSSFSTFAYENIDKHGFNSEVIELCLDHRERNKIKAAYNRSKMLEQRRGLMQWWSDFIDGLKN